MTESAVIGILKICVRGLQLPCNESTECLIPSSIELIVKVISSSNCSQNVWFQITAAMNRFIRIICEKRLLFLKRSKNDKPQQQKQWWEVIPWTQIFEIIQIASSRQSTLDISCKMFCALLGVFDENDFAQSAVDKSEQRLVFLATCPYLMQKVVDLYDIFIQSKFHSDICLKLMMIKGIFCIFEQKEVYQTLIDSQISQQQKEHGSEPGNECKAQNIMRTIRVFIVYIVRLCANECSVIRTKALLLMEYVLLKSSVSLKLFDADFVEDALSNILCSDLITMRLCGNLSDTNSFELITKSRIFAISLLTRFFLKHLNEFSGHAQRGEKFEMIWNEMIGCFETMYQNKGDPKYNELYVSIKENLKNVLQVMIYQQIINSSSNIWTKINAMFPRIKDSLFDNAQYPDPTPTGHIDLS